MVFSRLSCANMLAFGERSDILSTICKFSSYNLPNMPKARFITIFPPPTPPWDLFLPLGTGTTSDEQFDIQREESILNHLTDTLVKSPSRGVTVHFSRPPFSPPMRSSSTF